MKGSFWIEYGNNLKATSGSKNDLVDPESINNFKLYSGKIIYGNSLEVVVFNEIISGVTYCWVVIGFPENPQGYLVFVIRQNRSLVPHFCIHILH